MPVAKATDTARLARIEEALAQNGLSTSGPSKDLDRAALARLAAEGVELVDVHLTRWEVAASAWGARARRSYALPSHQRVALAELLGDFSSWLYSRHGGGEYEVDLTSTENTEWGVLYRFKINVHGAPRKPETVLAGDAARKVGGLEAVSEMAKQLEASGIPAPSAWAAAQQMIKENPYLAVGASPREDDDMDLTKMMMLMQQQERAAEREREARREQREAEQREWERRQALLAPPRGPDPEVLALRDQLAKMEARTAAAETEARLARERAETNARFERIERLLEAAATRKPEGPDPVATTMASMTNLFAAISQRGSTEQAQSAAQQAELMKMVLAANQGRAAEFQAMVEAQLKGASFQLDVEKLKMEQPMQYAQVIGSLMGMFGGLAKAQSDIIMSMNQGNPMLDAMREAGAAIPQLIQGLIGNETTRAGSYAEPQSPGNDDAALQRDIEIAKRAMAGRAVTAPAEAKQVATTTPQAIGGGDGKGTTEGSVGDAVQGAAGAQAAPAEAGGAEGASAAEGAGAGDPGAAGAAVEGAADPAGAAGGGAAAPPGGEGAPRHADGEGAERNDEAADGADGADGAELTFAEAQERSLEMLTSLGMERAAALLQTEDGVNVVLALTDPAAAPSELAKDLADAIARLEAEVHFHPEGVQTALKEDFGWSHQRAAIFVRSFIQRMTELAARAAAAAQASEAL